MTEIYEKEGVEYTKSNHRMRYNPEFHENHGQPFTIQELIYLCSSYESMKKQDLALALGRTVGTVMSKAHHLRKIGKFDYYKSLAK